MIQADTLGYICAHNVFGGAELRHSTAYETPKTVIRVDIYGSADYSDADVEIPCTRIMKKKSFLDLVHGIYLETSCSVGTQRSTQPTWPLYHMGIHP